MFEKWKARVELLAFLFAIGYAIITFFQWRDAGKNFQAGQRAWIGADIGSTITPIKLGKGTPNTWLVFFKNFGNSPALHVKWRTATVNLASHSIDWSKVQEMMAVLDLSQEREYVVFNGDRVPNPGTDYKPLSVDERAAVLDGSRTILLIGRVSYVDIFEINHETQFCIVYAPGKEVGFETWHDCPTRTIAT